MEYRRFVSYLYEYRKGEKKENRGFVKAEVRQNTARFLIHMYLPEKREQLYRVYGFSKQTNVRVLMGQDHVRNGNVDIRLQMPIDAIGIEEEKTQMNVLSGIFLRGSDNSLYATLWEEGELPAELLEDKPEEKTSPSSREEEQIENIEADHGAAENAETSDADTEKAEDTKQEKQQSGNAETKDLQQDNVKNEKTIMESRKTEQLSGRNENIGNAGSKQAAEPQITKQDAGEPDGWDELILKTPRAGTLEGYEDTIFLRIEPRHLRYFPRNLWHLGRNSFLLHGYYNYRYLIAAKYKDGILVGIPGNYSPREEQMASLFGFGRFQAGDINSPYPGSFGYWLGYFKGD